MNEVERIAKALFHHEFQGKGTWEHETGPLREYWMEAARVAIAAMADSRKATQSAT